MIKSFQMEPTSKPVVNITTNPQHRLLLPTTLEAAAASYSSIPIKCAEATVPDQIVPTNISLASNQVVDTDDYPPVATTLRSTHPHFPYPVKTRLKMLFTA